MVTVTKNFEFEAAHKLPNYEGDCKNLHGHTFKMEVEIGADNNFDSIGKDGMLIDYKNLKSIVQDLIIKKLDHKYLNDILPNPTSEMLLQLIVNTLSEFWKDNLQRVRLYETTNSYCEWKR